MKKCQYAEEQIVKIVRMFHARGVLELFFSTKAGQEDPSGRYLGARYARRETRGRYARGISNVRELRMFCLALALLLTHIAASAQPTWLFGRHAVIEWKPGPVSTRLWPDTSETAPGILWDGMGRPMLYRVARSFAWNDGTFIPSTDTIDPDNPNDYYWSIAGNVPDAILVRKPGSRDTVYSIQSHQEGGSPKRRWRYLENGALTAHTLDLSKRDGMGFAHLASDTIVKAYDSAVGLQQARRAATASQALIPHANGRDLWLIVPMYFPSQVVSARASTSVLA